MPERFTKKLHATWLVFACLTGCAVGPDYTAPEPVLPETFGTDASADAVALPAADALWASFEDQQLDELISLAMTQNTTVAQAVAAMNETRALSGLQIYSWFPTVSTSAEVDRSRPSESDPFVFGDPGVREIYRVGFDAAWEIDVFGGLRRQSEQIRRLVEADEATVYAVQLAIVAEVAQTYFQWQGDARRLALLQQNLASQGESVAILEASLEAGRGTSLDVARARSVMQQIAASIPLVRANQSRDEQRLAALTRTPVAEIRDRWNAHGEMPALPPSVAAGSPVDWLLRRPDVRAAERRLAAATAGIGVSTAEFYPRFNLIGGFGWTGSEASQVGDSNADRWRVAPTLTWRIFDFGRVRQRVMAAEARAAGAMAAFDEAWLKAIEETENALANYTATTERVDALELALQEGSRAAELAKLRYDAGSDDYLSVLDADRGRINLEDQLVQAKTDRATGLAALYKALGGDFTEVLPAE